MTSGAALEPSAAYVDDLLEVSKYDEGEPANGLMVDAGRPVTRVAAAVNTSFATETSGIQALADDVARHFQLRWDFVKEDPDIQ